MAAGVAEINPVMDYNQIQGGVETNEVLKVPMT